MAVRNRIGIRAASESPQEFETYKVVHPDTQEFVHDVQRSAEADLLSAIDMAHRAATTWSALPLASRQKIISEASTLLEDVNSGWKDTLSSANRKETSVGEWWSREQLNFLPQDMRVLVDSAEDALKWEDIKKGDHTFRVKREPYGVCLSMAAWNAVHVLTMRSIITPLLAGNTVVLKTSETTPLTQTLWAELLYAAGVPRECLCVVHVAPEDAPQLVPLLIRDFRVRHVNFTGSTRVGSILASLAGQYLKPSVMELGGKAPVIILPDADLDVAANNVLFGAFMNAGQICMSTERIIVARSQYQDLAARLRSTWSTVKAKASRVLFSENAAQRVRLLLNEALEAGATSILDDDQVLFETGSARITPSIIGPITRDMRIYREETFAPVAVIIVVEDTGRELNDIVDEMVSIANDSDFGLTAAIWGRDQERNQAVASRLHAGAVHINSPTNADPPYVPHGGWKSSGWGRFNGVDGLRSFTQTKTIESSTAPPQMMSLDLFEL